MEEYRRRIISWVETHGVHGITEFNQNLLAEMESQPLQLCVLGQQTQAKEDFVKVLSTADGSFIPPRNSSVFMSRNLSRMPSCENMQCIEAENSSHVPGLAKMKEVDVRIKGKSPEKTIGPFILEKVKLSIDEDVLTQPPLGQYGDGVLQEALSRIESSPKASKLNIGIHEFTEPDMLQKNVIGDDVLYDAFLISMGSRYIRKTDLDMAQWCSQYHRRRAMLVYTHIPPENNKDKRENAKQKDPDWHKNVKRYYRQKLFKYKLSDISLFMVDIQSHEYDFPELLRILQNWDKRKNHRRKHAVAKVEKDLVSKAIANQRKYSIGPAIICGLLTGLPHRFPVGPLLCDIALGLVRYWWYPASLGLPIEVPTIDKISSAQTPTNRAIYLASHAPCTMAYLVQFTSRLLVESTLPSLHAAVCGLVAGGVYTASQSMLTQSLDAHWLSALRKINTSVGDHT